MGRKITYIAVALVSLISIAIVAFFGVVPQAEPKEVPAKEIMFVDRKGGTEENRMKNSSFITIESEIMEAYYYITPVNATSKAITVYVDDYGAGSNITVGQISDGVLQIDFHGSRLKSNDMFTIKIIQTRDAVSCYHNYIIR